MLVLQYKNLVLFWRRPCPRLSNVTCSIQNMHCVVQGKYNTCGTVCYIIFTISALLIPLMYTNSRAHFKRQVRPCELLSKGTHNTCEDIPACSMTNTGENEWNILQFLSKWLEGDSKVGQRVWTTCTSPTFYWSFFLPRWALWGEVTDV